MSSVEGFMVTLEKEYALFSNFEWVLYRFRLTRYSRSHSQMYEYVIKWSEHGV